MSIATCSMEFASKKESNARDLQISSLDIRSSRHICVITTSNPWPHPSLPSVTSTSGLYPGLFIIAARVFSLSWALSRCSEVYQEDYFQIPVLVAWEGVTSIAINESHWKTISRSLPNPDPVVVVWEKYPWLLFMKATGGSHSEWWAGRLAGRSKPDSRGCQHQLQPCTILLNEQGWRQSSYR